MLSSPLPLGPCQAPSRLMFGPHVTNLGDDDRQFTARHTAYYARRAIGGCGVIVTEGASVHDSDWPYERAPLAHRCAPGWSDIAATCHEHGTLVIASLDHAGGQGSSAYSQLPLWAPSRVPEVNSRETPKWMEGADIDAVIDGFAIAARIAVGAGCDGVEINAGQHSLVRQFMSGLTNHRDDSWGQDRLLFARQVIEAVRPHAALVGLRLCCDELAPWAGMTPDVAPGIAADLAAAGIDYVVVVRGSIYTAEKTRPDFHEAAGFNIDVCRAVKAALPSTAVYLQGSVVEPGQAEWAIGEGICDGVEMTRAQIAEPDLVVKLRSDQGAAIRPCIRCNQRCQVRDARNPIVSCVGEPTAGRETEDPDWYANTSTPRRVVVVGGGIAGLEAARVAASRGHGVALVERAEPCRWLGRRGRAGRTAGRLAGSRVSPPRCRDHHRRHNDPRWRCDHSMHRIPTGPTRVRHPGSVDGHRRRRRPRAVPRLPDGRIALFDPIGGPIAVALAEELGERAILITQDHIAGNELSVTGDLAPANVRLAQRGVTIERRSLLRSVRLGAVEVEDRFTGERRTIAVRCARRLRVPASGRPDRRCRSPGRRLRCAADDVRGRPRGPSRRLGRRSRRLVDVSDARPGCAETLGQPDAAMMTIPRP